jgi:hypothetical protein
MMTTAMILRLFTVLALALGASLAAAADADNGGSSSRFLAARRRGRLPDLRR